MSMSTATTMQPATTNQCTVSSDSIEQQLRNTMLSPQQHIQHSNNAAPLPPLQRQYTEDADIPENNNNNNNNQQEPIFNSSVLPQQTVDKTVNDITQPLATGADVETESRLTK